MEGGATHGLEQLMCVRGAPTPIYKGGRGEEAGLGVPQVGRNPTWTPSPIRPHFPFTGKGKGEGEGVGEGKGVAPPFPSPIWPPPLWGGTSPFWAG